MLLPTWVRSYKRSWIKNDIMAGLTLAAFLIPAGLGDATLANLPPEAGLYACLFAGLVFWIFSSSTHTVITVTSAISLLIGATLGTIANGESSQFAVLASATAFLVGAIALIAWFIRAGVIINFVSESVMVGFKFGIGLFLISTQLPKLLGFSSGHGTFIENSTHIVKYIHTFNPTSTLLGIGALAVLVAGKIFAKNQPISLVVIILGVVASLLFHLESYGVKILGIVPTGLPMPGLPGVGWDHFNELLPLAFAAFLLASVETSAIGRMFPNTDGRRFDPNKEFLAIGAANIAAGLFRGFPVSGGVSQSLVNSGAKARSLFSGVVSSIVILLVILFFAHWLTPLPQPVLGAIILVAVSGLIKPSVLLHLYRVEREEFFIALSVIAGVLASGLLRGIFIGVIISIILLMKRASHPHIARLGRIAGSAQFVDLKYTPEAQSIPDTLIFRIESSMIYFNIDYVRDTLNSAIRKAKPSRVFIDLSATPYIDHQSALTLAEFADTLKQKGVDLFALEAHGMVRAKLLALGLDHRLGRDDPTLTIANAIS
jgi:high affinity sulfate transporter 1